MKPQFASEWTTLIAYSTSITVPCSGPPRKSRSVERPCGRPSVGLSRRASYVATGVAFPSNRELWAFVHDTNPPRIQTVSVDDSVSATVSFSQMLDPRQRFDVKQGRLVSTERCTRCGEERTRLS